MKAAKKWALFFGVTCLVLSQQAMAINASSDTSKGSASFTQAFGADGEFSTARQFQKWHRDDQVHGVWNADYTYTRINTTDVQGNAVVDNTSGIEVGVGNKKRKGFEYGVGFAYANTQEENLKDYGPDIYYGHTLLLGDDAKDEFVPSISFKLTLTEMAYIQTFGSTSTTRLGKAKPTTGVSGIGQFAPKLEVTLDLLDPLSFRLGYTYFFYNRNVPDFIATLDSPQAVSAGIYGLTNAVSSFYLNQTEADITYTPLDKWEFDLNGTEGTSALDSSLTWTVKGGFLFQFVKDWRGGLALEYVSTSVLSDHIYTLSVKYEPD